MSAPATRLLHVVLDGEALTRLSPLQEADRAQAVADLEAENEFAPSGLTGPFVLHLSIQEGRLAFDIRNEAGRHVGFGNGAHACAGQGLARLETTAMLKALVERVDRIEIAADPRWAINNIIHRHARLPVRLIAAG